MSRRVYLHVGTMKSGTSYVQGLFDSNRDRLAEHGLLWTESVDYYRAFNDLLGSNRVRPGIEGTWRALRRRVNHHDGDAVVSNELLAPINQRRRTKVVRALRPARVEVVVTARDLGRVVPSHWQTAVRSRSTLSWEDFVAAVTSDDESKPAAAFWRRQDVAAVITRWAKTVPIEQIRLVTVPPAGSDPDLLGRRFASVVGVDTGDFVPPERTNPSVGVHSAELIRQLNARTEDLDWLHYKWAYKNALSRLVLARHAEVEPSLQLGQDQLDRIRARAEVMIAAIAETGVDVVGDLTDLMPSAEATGPPVEPTATGEAELLDAAVAGVEGMGRLLAELRVEHEALVRVLEDRFVHGASAARYERFYQDDNPDDWLFGSALAKSRFLRAELARQTGELD